MNDIDVDEKNISELLHNEATWLRESINSLVRASEAKFNIPGKRQVRFHVETYRFTSTHRQFLVNEGVQVDWVSKKLSIR